MTEQFDLKEVLKQCYWAAREYRSNPSDDYIIEKIVGFIDSNNLFYPKYRAQSPAPDRAKALEALETMRTYICPLHYNTIKAALTHPEETAQKAAAWDRFRKDANIDGAGDYAETVASIRADRGEIERLKAENERLARENAGLKAGLWDIAKAIVKKDNGVCDTIWVSHSAIGDYIASLLDTDIDFNDLYVQVNCTDETGAE